tara:strand:- start:19809 stop:22022 length:2214 start_codon:yes stop_codon:yes gene_type:complete
MLLFAVVQGEAQTRTVSGQVLDAEGRPVAGATIGHLADEVTTDEDGRFVLPLSHATADIVVVADTFQTLITTVLRGQRHVDLRLVATSKDADEVIHILGKTQDTSSVAETKPTRYELSPELIRRVPGAGNDALKSIQTMPGVGRVPYGMGGLVLRGNSPRDSNVFLDGIEVPLLYHFGGLASFYPSTTLKSLELMGGGYSAEFGRGLGGLVTVESRGARDDRWRVTPEMSMVDLSLQADGPTSEDSGVSIGLRRSIIDAVLPAIGTSSEITTAPRYYDGQLRYDTRLWRGARLSARIFGSDDEIGLLYGERMDRKFIYGAQFSRAGLHFEQEVDKGLITLAPWIGTDDFRMESVDQKMLSQNNPYGGRSSYLRTFSLGSVSAGVDLSGGDFEVKSTTIADGQFTIIERENTYFNAGAWLRAKMRFLEGRLNISPGIRVEHYSLSSETVVDPRIVISHEVNKALTIRESLGSFHQPPSISDSLWGNEDLESSYSIQAALGAEYKFSNLWSASTTGFYSRLHNLAIDDPNAPKGALSNLTTSKLGALASSREFMAKQFGTFSSLLNEGSGRNVGLEFMVQYIGQRSFAWLSYTGSRAERRSHIEPELGWTRYVLDQPHVLTIIGSTKWGNWQFGARGRYASGNAFTPILGGAEGPNGQTVPVYGEEYSERLPDFFQVDLRVDRVWQRSWGTINAFLDVQNVTMRVNTEGRLYEDDYESYEETEGLPLFPAFGLSYAPNP